MERSKKSVLAIESSCDETSVCELVHGAFNEATLSSLAKFENLGGIIPEVASRDHEVAFPYCLQKMKAGQYDSVAYTNEPGLPGSLMVGKVVAQTLAWLHKAELVPVNHIHGHVFSSFISAKPPLPALAMVVSGGHTAIYYVKNDLKVTKLIASPDDAVGEVLDKVGRLLGYPYPGGPHIDSAYSPKDATIKFIGKKPFSFSGIKTAIVQHVERNAPLSKDDVVAIGSSANKALVDILIHHLKRFIVSKRPASIVLGGGVCANRLLRQEVQKLGLPCFLPELRYCGDNATMIAAAAAILSK